MVSSITAKGGAIGAVVFDLDGTLIHTTVDFRRMKEQMVADLTKRGVPSHLLDPKGTIVDNLGRVSEYFFANGREAEMPDVFVHVTEMMNRTEMEKVSGTLAIDGAVSCLQELKGRGLRIGLLTRGSRRYAEAALRYADLDISFDAMVCRDDFPEEEAKPNGKAMVRIASMLDMEPGRCVLVGDHLIDLNCARSTSALFVGVLTGSFGREDWSKNGCSLVIDSVADLPTLLRADK